MKTPNKLVYELYILASKFVSKFMFNLKIDKNDFKNIKGPCVILANHESSIDFMCLAASLKSRAHFVISNSFYQINPIKKLLDAAGTIPKQQFQTSLGDMKKIKSALDNNIPLVIYPAGMMTENGITTPIPKATGKMVKWLNHDVYVACIKGSYLTNPKWGKKWRKGQINLSLKKIYSKEDLQDLDALYIQEVIEKELYYDAYENQETLLISYKNGDCIEGIENVLYWCPKCNSYHTMVVTNKNTLYCTNCGNKAIANKYGFFEKGTSNSVIYKHASKWSKEIKVLLYDEITKNPNFKLEDNCEIQMINMKKRKFETVGKALISLDKESFKLKGHINNEKFEKSFNVGFYPTLPFKPGKHFEIQDNDKIYRIILNNKKHTVKWISSLEILHQEANKK